MANNTRKTCEYIVEIAKGYRMGAKNACYDWRPGGATTMIGLPSFIALATMFTLYVDLRVDDETTRVDTVIDQAMDHLANMNMPRREDGYPVEITSSSFGYAERYFRQAIKWATHIDERRRSRRGNAA